MTPSIDPTSDDTLLSYALAVQPSPLQAGQKARLILVMSNAGGERVTCGSIVLTLPAGTDATDLIDGGSAIATEPPTGWTADVAGGAITFTAPAGGAAVDSASLVFTIAVTINEQPGTATIALEETAWDEDDPSQARTTGFTLDKFPADFSLSDLIAVPADALDIAYGRPAFLSWTATGAGVSCTLDYQPADAGEPVSQSVPNVAPAGAFRTEALTRSEGVVFTLRAEVGVVGQDNPMVALRQLAVTVEALSLTMSALPPTIGPNGLILLQWDAPNADHCVLDDGSILPPSGTRYIVLRATHHFTVVAVTADGPVRERQATVTVDPSIVATEAGHVLTGGPGAIGADWQMGKFGPSEGGVGGLGGSISLGILLPPLLPAGNPDRVIPIALTGGAGGKGGLGPGVLIAYSGSGGRGGDAILTASWDSTQSPPAQYLITLSAGSGGSPGAGGGGRPGGPGTASATIDGQTVTFM